MAKILTTISPDAVVVSMRPSLIERKLICRPFSSSTFSMRCFCDRAKAVESPDDEGITGLQLIHTGGEARAFGFRSAGFVDEDEFFGDADMLEGIELEVEFLAVCRNSGIADLSPFHLLLWIELRIDVSRCRLHPDNFYAVRNDEV